jgi:hypothetical protein
MSLENIQNEFRNPNLVPGSAEEKDLLLQLRTKKQQNTDDFKALKKDALDIVVSEKGVVAPVAAQHAAEMAMEIVTGEHSVVPAQPNVELPAPVTPEDQPPVLH